MQARSLTALERLVDRAPTLSVGLLTADLLNLGAEVKLLEQSGAQVAHFDVMDGVFCPAMTFGAPLVKAVRTTLLKDVHLMVEEPLDKVDAFVAAGADIVTVHVESTRHIHRVLQKLGGMVNANDPSRGIVRGLALNPGTPLSTVEPMLGDIDLILLLAVNPGFAGQSFLPSAAGRLQELRARIDASGHRIVLCVDGGITKKNVAAVTDLGADLVVTGSAVFDGKTPLDNARELLATVAAAGSTRRGKPGSQGLS